MNGDDGYEIVKWYTRARRFPKLIGKTPDGTRIWGGPYTYTQVIVAVVVLVVGNETLWLWGQFGLVGNALVLVGGSYGAAVAAGRLPIGMRSPVSVGVGCWRALTAPAHGVHAGMPVRLPRASVVRSQVVVSTAAARRPAPTPADTAVSPVPAPVATPPAPVSTTARHPAAIPALTGVQRLLASSGATHQES